MKQLTTLLLTISALSLSFPVPSFAIDFCPAGQFGALCGFQASNIGSTMRNVIVAILIVAAVLSLFFLIYGGIRWILSGGDKGKIGEARATLTAAIVGLIITFMAYFILNVVLGLFGLNVSQLQLPVLTK